MVLRTRTQTHTQHLEEEAAKFTASTYHGPWCALFSVPWTSCKRNVAQKAMATSAIGCTPLGVAASSADVRTWLPGKLQR